MLGDLLIFGVVVPAVNVSMSGNTEDHRSSLRSDTLDDGLIVVDGEQLAVIPSEDGEERLGVTPVLFVVRDGEVCNNIRSHPETPERELIDGREL